MQYLTLSVNLPLSKIFDGNMCFKLFFALRSESELRSMDIRGLKKLDNYLRRQEEMSQWEAGANAEDIEFFRCQEQLQEQLLTQHTQVERVIGESLNDVI